MIKLCIAGATGRMGKTLIKEAKESQFSIVGAVTSNKNPNIGKTLKELNLDSSNTTLVGPSGIKYALEEADIYVSFTNTEAELENIPVVAEHGVKIVTGTTGFNENEIKLLESLVSNKVPAVFAPNFSLGVNVLLKILEPLSLLPNSFDISIVEAHHTGKKDAPSGTANAIGDVVSRLKGYDSLVHGRSGISPRKSNDIEIMSVRAGGIPGTHQIIVAGPYEMIKIEHTAFTRSVFAHGALLVAEWISGVSQPGLYSLDDVLEARIHENSQK
jgi:4-hydroxy-tetrahydrodipicolinate reductase